MKLEEQILLLKAEDEQIHKENIELKKLFQEVLDKLYKNSDDSSKFQDLKELQV